jgi:hypothetical protein
MKAAFPCRQPRRWSFHSQLVYKYLYYLDVVYYNALCVCNVYIHVVGGTGGIFGQLLGGWAGQRLYNRDPRLQCVLMGLSTLLAVPPMLLLLTVQEAGQQWGGALPVYSLSLISGLLIFANGPNCRVVLQVCIPHSVCINK